MRAIHKEVIIIILIISFTLLFISKIKDEMVDFEVCYKAGKRLISGEMLYQLTDGHYQFKYPPFYAFLVSPLSSLCLNLAKLIWFYIVICLIFLILYFSYLLIPFRKKKWPILVIPTFLILVKFYGRELDLGQANVLMVLSLMIMIYFSIEENEKGAGVFLGLASVIKPYAIIFFPYFLIKKKFLTVINGTLFFILALTFPIIRYGVKGNLELLKNWQHTLSLSTPGLLASQDNVSIIAFFAKWFGTEKLNLILILSGSIIAFLILLFLLIVFQGRKVQKSSHILESALLLIFIPLFSPLGWDYIFLSSTLAIMMLINYIDRFPKSFKYLLIINFIFIGATLYDLLGRQIYSQFMRFSILTINFIIVVFYLSYLRLKQLC
ncbi:MAG: glycosyltransferase family 87 protein [Candidatus Aminicenantia bacterium]